MDAEVVVIGAGVLGISLSYHLAKQGRSVIVLEREPSYAHHASGTNAGQIRQLYRHPKLTSWASRSLAAWSDSGPLSEVTTSGVFQKTGSLVLGRTTPGHHDELFEEKTLNVARGSNRISIPAVFAKDDGLLDSSSYVALLKAEAHKNNARFSFRSQVTGIERMYNSWETRTASGEVYKSSWVVNAAGAWLNKLLDSTLPQQRVAASAYARHLFVVDGFSEDFMPEKNLGFYWDEDLGWYMRLWDKPSRLVSVCDQTAADPDCFSPNPEIAEEVSQKLMLALPTEFPGLSLARSWHCFRTYTKDLLPVWGEDPNAPGLFWLGAFGGLGMSTSYAAAEDAALYITGRSVSVPEDFTPDRVQERAGESAVAS